MPADADGDAGGEIEVGGAEAGGQEQRGPERQAGIGDDALPAVAAEAGEAGIARPVQPAISRAGLGERSHRRFQRVRRGSVDPIRSPVRTAASVGIVPEAIASLEA